MTEQIRDYQEEDKINKFALDREWEEQGDKYIYWSTMAAKAVKNLEDCNLRRKIMKAELYKEHRENFVQDGTKFSEAMLDAEVHADPKYKAVSLEQIQLQEEATIMTDIKWNFQQRQGRIEHLQQLRLAGYYADPGGGKEVQQELTGAMKGRLRRGQGD